MKYLKSYNESVRDHLKPKSEEEILNKLSDLNNKKLIEFLLKYNFDYAIKKVLQNGITKYNLKILFDNDLSESVVRLLLNDSKAKSFMSDNVIYVLEKYVLGLHQNEPLKSYEDWIIEQFKNLDIFISKPNPISRYKNFLNFKKDNETLFSYIIDIKEFDYDMEIRDKLITDFDLNVCCINRMIKKLAQDYIKLNINDCTWRGLDAQYWVFNKGQKRISNIDTYILESVRDQLKPISEEEVKRLTKKMTSSQKLMFGCRHGFLWLIEEAIDEGADPHRSHKNVDSQSHFLIKPLGLACDNGHLNIVKYLLDLGVEPEYSFLMISTVRGYTDIVKILLQYQIILDFDINHVIKVATDRGYYDIAEILTDYKNNNMNTNESVRDHLKPKSEEEILKNLKQYIGNPQELLKVSCFYGILDGVKMALKRKADPTIRFNEPIGMASYYNHPGIVEYLLNDERVDASDLDNYAIRVAEEGEYKDVISLLLKDEKVRNKLSRFKISKLNKLVK